MGGGLEVAHIDGKSLILDEAVTAQGGLDVNYGMIDGSRFYVAATTYKEGAFLGYVELANGLMGKSKLVTYPIDKTNPNNGIDANSVVKYKDNFVWQQTRVIRFTTQHSPCVLHTSQQMT